MRTLIRSCSICAALAALAFQTTSCSSDGGLDRSGFELTSCDEQGLVSAVEPAEAVDYLAMRRVFFDFHGNIDLPAPMIVAEVGVACDRASDESACQEAVDGLPIHEGFSAGPTIESYYTAYQLVWTRGDDVGAVTTEEGLRAFLGTVDGPEEALLVAEWTVGHTVLCQEPNTRETDDGVRVLTTTGFTCGAGTSRSENVLEVASDGTVTILDTEVVEVGNPGCVI